MNNNKQSSIELFAIALYEKGFLKGNGDAINDLLEEHKAMHKEEVITFTADWIIQWKEGDRHSIGKYYNETFGGDNE